MAESKHYCAGLIAGEGSFVITTTNSGDRIYIKPKFTMSLHKSDKAHLEASKEVVGVGKIYTHCEDKVQWTVREKEELEKLTSFIEDVNSPLWESSSKYENFQVWKEAVEIYTDGPTRDSQKIEIAEIAKELNTEFGDNRNWDEFIRQVKDHE